MTPTNASEAARRRIILWAPALIALGVWAYYAAPQEPPLWSALGALAVAAGLMARARRDAAIYLAAALLCVAVGFGAAKLRVATVAAPRLAAQGAYDVAGVVEEVDQSRSGRARVVIHWAESAPEMRVRVALAEGDSAAPGDCLRLRAQLSPPGGPMAPGGFDFGWRDYHRGVGGIGYARSAATRCAEPAQGLRLRLQRLRSHIADALTARLGPEIGGVAAALTVGDKSRTPPAVTEAMRVSGLAHLLAISGLHVGLLSGIVFFAARVTFGASRRFGARWSARKAAAIAALIAAAGYAALSGWGVATQRAFVMVAVALAAIVLNRAPVTMRSLAAAAALVLLWRPESLFDAGFQMSFAASFALIAGFEATSGFWLALMARGWRGRAAMFVAGTVFTSLLAGAATAPFAAHHFNRLAAYSLPANLAATPLMGAAIMPALALAAPAALIGAEDAPLAAAGASIGYVIAVAKIAASAPGAAQMIPAAPNAAMAILAISGLWLGIWITRWRWLGLVGAAAAVGLWALAPRPVLLIAQGGALVAGRGEDGALWLSRGRGAAFAAEIWLRGDGDDADQAQAYARRDWRCGRGLCRGRVAGVGPVALYYRRAPDPRACAQFAMVIAPDADIPPSARPAGCVVLDRGDLRATGYALYPGAATPRPFARPAARPWGDAGTDQQGAEADSPEL